ncbi:Protein kinase superfamily protein [Zea mays]|uniref:Protein kinase superfamily protein n=1 Tax=Zea mays TaxID=4577 RepID=A0A1D6HVQ1_MAIZE|nr:Protein kinase superfamily protein [Zea mays]
MPPHATSSSTPRGLGFYSVRRSISFHAGAPALNKPTTSLSSAAVGGAGGSREQIRTGHPCAASRRNRPHPWPRSWLPTNVLGTVGDLIKSGAFRQVYLGMDLDSSEILAIKQAVLFDQRYIGTAWEENTLNILLEFVPGGSIQSLLRRLGSFPEVVLSLE